MYFIKGPVKDIFRQLPVYFLHQLGLPGGNIFGAFKICETYKRLIEILRRVKFIEISHLDRNGQTVEARLVITLYGHRRNSIVSNISFELKISVFWHQGQAGLLRDHVSQLFSEPL
jgi:hypothetical protein